MYWAVKRNKNSAVVSVLLKHGADPNAMNEEYMRPLRIAVTHDMPKVVVMLLNNGADPSVRDTDGNTLLHLAVDPLSKSNPTVINALLSAGADPNVPDMNGYTPLHLAAKWSENPRATEPVNDFETPTVSIY